MEEIANEFTAPPELIIDSGALWMSSTTLASVQTGPKLRLAAENWFGFGMSLPAIYWQPLRGDMSRTSYGNVNAVAWSPDGEFLLVGVSDYREHGNIRVYSTNNLQRIVEVLTGHSAPTRQVAFARDGQLLTSVDADGLIIVRNWKSREILHRIPARNSDQPIFDLMKFPTNEPYLLGVDFEGPKVFSGVNGELLGPSDKMPKRIRGWLVDIFNKLVNLPYNAKAQPRVMDFRMEEGRWAGAGEAVVDVRSRFWIRIWESRDPVANSHTYF